jgi:hypothetical protein
MKYRAASLTRSVDDASSRSASSDASVTTDVRTEYDSLGAVEMPADGYGARIAGAFQHRARPDAVRDHPRLRALGGDRQCSMSSIVSPVDRDRLQSPAAVDCWPRAPLFCASIAASLSAFCLGIIFAYEQIAPFGHAYAPRSRSLTSAVG